MCSCLGDSAFDVQFPLVASILPTVLFWIADTINDCICKAPAVVGLACWGAAFLCMRQKLRAMEASDHASTASPDVGVAFGQNHLAATWLHDFAWGELRAPKVAIQSSSCHVVVDDGLLICCCTHHQNSNQIRTHPPLRIRVALMVCTRTHNPYPTTQMTCTTQYSAYRYSVMLQQQ